MSVDIARFLLEKFGHGSWGIGKQVFRSVVNGGKGDGES
jgi:hypothetical protein